MRISLFWFCRIVTLVIILINCSVGRGERTRWFRRRRRGNTAYGCCCSSLWKILELEKLDQATDVHNYCCPFDPAHLSYLGFSSVADLSIIGNSTTHPAWQILWCKLSQVCVTAIPMDTMYVLLIINYARYCFHLLLSCIIGEKEKGA